jgi:hypothetical protein
MKKKVKPNIFKGNIDFDTFHCGRQEDLVEVAWHSNGRDNLNDTSLCRFKNNTSVKWNKSAPICYHDT